MRFRKGDKILVCGQLVRVWGYRTDRDVLMVYGPRDVIARELTLTYVERFS